MRISIITPSLNQGKFIEETIRSVMNQNHDDVEHIVMDGESTDNTVSILERYSHLKWVREKDSGQSNAINKGFRSATGEILGWLNSDDYYEKNIFADIVRYFQSRPDCMMLYGDISFVNSKGELITKITGDTINHARLIQCPDVVRQPSFFWRRTLMDQVGMLDETLHLVMDFDFFLRISKHHHFHYLPKNFSYYRLYDQNKSVSLGRRQVLEMYMVYRKNKISFTPAIALFLVKKLMRTFAPMNGLIDFLRKQRRHNAPS
ncbi:MAG: glycosyltransferase [Ignavibacteriales bacterium]|nr:glycosyltransferase [Ignavibacteriales bacterium]